MIGSPIKCPLTHMQPGQCNDETPNTGSKCPMDVQLTQHKAEQESRRLQDPAKGQQNLMWGQLNQCGPNTSAESWITIKCEAMGSDMSPCHGMPRHRPHCDPLCGLHLPCTQQWAGGGFYGVVRLFPALHFLMGPWHHQHIDKVHIISAVKFTNLYLSMNLHKSME
jgi:hypothetical protein